MNSTSKLCFLAIILLVLSCTMESMTMAQSMSSSGPSLATRLQLDDESACWDSLTELKSCTGEVILFFLNGETFLGPSCCMAIRVIEHNCWPAMLGSIGFTDEEGDILLGYCDAADSPPPSQPSVPSPPSKNTTVIASYGLLPWTVIEVPSYMH